MSVDCQNTEGIPTSSIPIATVNTVEKGKYNKLFVIYRKLLEAIEPFRFRNYTY